MPPKGNPRGVFMQEILRCVQEGIGVAEILPQARVRWRLIDFGVALRDKKINNRSPVEIFRFV